MLAEFKGSGEYCAIKALSKANILDYGNIQYLMAEKTVLTLATGSPFLSHLYMALQTRVKPPPCPTVVLLLTMKKIKDYLVHMPRLLGQGNSFYAPLFHFR